MSVKSKEAQKPSKAEVLVDVLKWGSFGFLAIGAIFGVPVLVGTALLDLGISDPLAREMIQGWKNLSERVKKALGGKDNTQAEPATQKPLTLQNMPAR